VITRLRFEVRAMGSLSVAELFAELGSATVAGVVAVALTTAFVPSLTEQERLIVIPPPFGSAGTVAPAPCSAATSAAPVGAGQAAPPLAVQDAVLHVRLVGAGDVMTVPFAASGPRLVTVISYVLDAPATTVSAA
jgi:hypothetical protein